MNNIFSTINVNSIFNILFNFMTIDGKICQPKLFLFIIILLILFIYIYTIIKLQTYKNGIIGLILLIIWFYIKMIYNTKICQLYNLSVDRLGDNIRFWTLITHIQDYIPYILIFLICICISPNLESIIIIIKNFFRVVYMFSIGSVENLINNNNNTYKENINQNQEQLEKQNESKNQYESESENQYENESESENQYENESESESERQLEETLLEKNL